MTQKLALFDFDGTLCRGDSVVPYLLYCIRKGYAPKHQLPRAVIAFFRQKLRFGTVAHAKETTLSFIKGRSVAEMDEVARGFFREEQQKKFFAEGREEILALKRQGITVMIVSASAEVWMRVLPEFLPVDGVIATPCEARDGHYTGSIPANCRGEEKVRRISSLGDIQVAAAYGDSAGDAPMLRLAEKPVLINPRSALVRLLPQAEIRRWS